MTSVLTSTKRHGQTAVKVNSHWKLLKTLINTDGDDKTTSTKVDQPQVISHGIHHISELSISKTCGKQLKAVVYNKEFDCYATICNEGKITVYFTNGKTKRVKSSEFYKGIIYITKTKHWVCWNDNDKLKLLNESFKTVSTSQSVALIHCAVYNKSSHEVITGGDGNITCWSFRYGGKFLMARKVITDYLCNNVVSGICLENPHSNSQRCFVSMGTSIASFNLFDSKCLSFHKNRHAREITSFLFFNPSKYLITAAKDGSIKVWKDDGSLEIAFVGHHASVNALAVYPFGNFILSSSNDMTLRVWSLEAKDEVDKMPCQYSIDGIGTSLGSNHLFTFSSDRIDLWKIKHVHNPCTLIGSKIKAVKQTTHPKFPLRIVCISEDAAVRILSSNTGDVITTFLVPDLSTITDVAYSPADGLIFTLLINGKILRSSTSSNPCTLTETWEVNESRRPCSCLCLYEYIVDDLMTNNSWENQQEDVTTQGRYQQGINDRTLLLGGCIDGYIVLFDWQNRKQPGKISFKIEAHQDEIVSMASNPKVDQVISSGLDNVIKIWRLFPFAEEALAPLMTLYFDEQPRHLCVSHHRLLVALYDRSRANYAITVYKTTRKERYDHSTEYDHSDEIVATTSCVKMRLFATASLDGSIRIWDESSRLRQIIKLNATPSALSFCSERGDLMVAIGDSIHKIKYACYMPKAYVFRMVAMEFKEFETDISIPVNDKIYGNLSFVDQQRITKARSLFMKSSFDAHSLAKDELAESEEEARRRTLALEKIQERESDLKKIRDGELHSSKKKPKLDEKMKTEAFEKYMSLFHKRTTYNSIPDDSEDENAPGYVEEDVYAPDRQPTGFFSIDPQKLPNENVVNDGENSVEEKPDVLTRIRSKSLPVISERENVHLDHNETTTALEDTSVELTCEKIQPLDVDTVNSTREKKTSSAGKKYVQKFKKGIIVGGERSSGYPLPTKPLQDVFRESTKLALVEDEYGDRYDAIVIAPDGYIPNSVVVALFADMRPKMPEKPKPRKAIEEVVPWRPPKLTDTQLKEIANKEKAMKLESPTLSEASADGEDYIMDIGEKMSFRIRSPVTQEDLIEETKDVEILKVVTPPLKLQSPTGAVLKALPSRETFIRPPLAKPEPVIVSAPPAAKPQSPTTVGPAPVVKPATPPIIIKEAPIAEQQPLPYFIIQFKGMGWFDKIFPNANPLTFPKPWTISAFVELLLIFLSKAKDFSAKHHIANAIMLLNHQEKFDKLDRKSVINAICTELNMPNGPAASWSYEQKQFVQTALKLLNSLRHYTAGVVGEFMVQYILGDKTIRSFIIDLFVEIGVENAEQYFLPELDDIDTWGVPESSVRTRVHDLCVSWLEKWLDQFKEHIRSLAGKINRATSGHIVRGTKTQNTPSAVKGILKSKEGKSKSKQEVSWNFDTMGELASEKATYIDAINYFSELQLQHEIDNSRARRHSVKREADTENKVRNTVLILPDIKIKPSLARLGQTHCSHCHPERETALAIDVFLPNIKQHTNFGVRNIALRLNTLTLNPFPEESDVRIYEGYKHHKLLTLRTSQKYFIPSRSYVQPEKTK